MTEMRSQCCLSSYRDVIWTVLCWTNSNVFQFSVWANESRWRWRADEVATNSVQRDNQFWIHRLLDLWIWLYSMPLKTFHPTGANHPLSTANEFVSTNNKVFKRFFFLLNWRAICFFWITHFKNAWNIFFGQNQKMIHCFGKFILNDNSISAMQYPIAWIFKLHQQSMRPMIITCVCHDSFCYI